LGNQQGISNVLNSLGWLAYRQRDYSLARSFQEACLTIMREVKDQRGIADALHSLGAAVYEQADYALSRTLWEQSLRMRWELENRWGIADSLEVLVGLAVVQQQPERATRLWGAAERLRDVIGSPLLPATKARYAADVAVARKTLGEDAFAAAKAEGGAMTIDQAVAYALQYAIQTE